MLPKQLAELPQSRTFGTSVATTLAYLGLDIFLPLKIGQPVFWIRGVIFLLGLVLIQLGVSIMAGSWLAITCLRVAIAFCHL